MYLTSANNLKFLKKIVPETRLHLDTKLSHLKEVLHQLKEKELLKMK